MRVAWSGFAGIVARLSGKVLNGIEAVGNALPHPATLFAILAALVVLVSWLGGLLGLHAVHPVDETVVEARSLLDARGLRWIYENVTRNFVDFPPLGYVLAVMVGIGVAEGSGLVGALVRALVLGAPGRLVTFAIVLAGVVSHLASEVGYVVLIPLGAMVFHALGRHPMAGLAAAFCGVSGGFGANLVIGSVDPILAGLSTSAAQFLDPDITISPAANLYFMFVSAILVVALGTWVTEAIVEPRLGTYRGHAERVPIEPLNRSERRGLWWAGLAALIVSSLLALAVVPADGLLRHPETGSILHSPFLGGIITAVLLLFLVPGLAYGIAVGTIRNDKDLMGYITKSMAGLAGYIVLVFFAAQFVSFFRYSNLGLILAIHGAETLRGWGWTGIPLVVVFVLFSAFVNLFMGSASAKWAILAPVFVPMLMLLGYHPALTQAAFRIGDSVTNVVTPMMSYFALIVTFAQRYDERYGIGTVISTMLPYTVLLTIGWTLLLVLWMLLGIPLGPDGPLYLAEP